ncbi:hypothetical protein KIK84_11445 [Curvibacter sp. CHRR-16]|uniref:hypothetical protein n=1 Tax=Curvibacter sp. CHRR-16 TaxID=2835872 RepID=UPI001BD9BC5D|nr:hypothetical protein [Curvibacter sp. CHRR-16]MBT0570946.1 hypothetical protein [Curvibacter sp. CHRR-16]
MPPLSALDVWAAPEFVLWWLVSSAAMLLVAWLDVHLARPQSAWQHTAQRLDERISPFVAPAMRWCMAVFFVTAAYYFHAHQVYLTPELRTNDAWVPVVQVLSAVAFVRRSSAWLGSLGIVCLYAGAISTYGWFHLLDYPVFLGVAAYLLLDSIYQGKHHDLALGILRGSAGFTLMWAGAEKWLFPWWSYAMVDNQLSALLMGLSHYAFMNAAGFIEFGAAFALTFGRAVPQLAALFLLVPFVAAVPVFGSLDLVGHAPIIAVLLALTLTRTRLPSVAAHRPRIQRIMGYGCAMALGSWSLVGLYWGLHAIAYGWH